ncbi:hypothetical protein Q8F55_006248 [Vanrija albida]|uniref:Uncharacterized protein n=1 Tax=Vanrija albida TaxID=181172 RepID=A0ABR3PWN5_9TREE
MSTAIALALAGALISAQGADAATWCRDRYTGRTYRCNRLSLGARIGIGIAAAVVVLLLFAMCGVMRRKKMQRANANYVPPPPPTNQVQPSVPYANNPPPPQGVYGSYSAYGNPAPPPNSYQPGGAAQGYYGNSRAADGQDVEHGYEYDQAKENELKGGVDSPPIYGQGNSYQPPSGPPPGNSYAPPPGAPPGATHFAPPSGPPPGKN